METSALTRRLAELVHRHYVLPERVPGIVDALTTVGDLPEQDGEARLARLNEVLYRASGDAHLRIRPRPPGSADDHETEWVSRMDREALENAGGIRSVTRLDPGTAVITIAPYLSVAHLAQPYIEAAFALAVPVNNLVFDLRDGRGGTPETVALICGYLLGDAPVHLQDVIERDGSRQQFWTSPSPRRLPPTVRVSVLTSAQTFSGCEELAYDLQSAGRAVVVGETTRGGAHPVSAFPLDDDLEVSIPVAMSRNVVTGTNWEGTGVIPDIACPATDALQVAISHHG